MDSTTSLPDITPIPTLLFRVGTTLYGCDVTAAREILPLRPMTRLPGAPADVRGLINIRGTIVTVLDLAVRLDPRERPREHTRDRTRAKRSILLVQHRDSLVGLIVDQVTDVRALVRELETAGAGAGSPASASGIVTGVGMTDDEAVVLLDLDALITQVLV